MENIFKESHDNYKNTVDPINDYIKQMSMYLSIMEGDNIDDCREFIIDMIKNKRYHRINDPVVTFLERGENGDRSEYTTKLSSYIKHYKDTNNIMVPSGTVYLHPDKKKSPISGYMTKNKKKRKIVKNEEISLDASGDYVRGGVKKLWNILLKTKNNAASGTFASESTCLHNPSAHYTLTSITRSVSSDGNGSNERLVGGNRHYRNPVVVIGDMMSILQNTDMDNVVKIMNKYNIHLPTPEEVLEMIVRCHKSYWVGANIDESILNLLRRMSPYQRAIYLYTGDLYHLRVYNDALVRDLIGRASAKTTNLSTNPKEDIYKIDEGIRLLSHNINIDILPGLGADYDKIYEAGHLDLITSTAINSQNVFLEYKDLIKLLFVSNAMPPNISFIKNMRRSDTVMSDTDSTCTAYDRWVEWYYGEIKFDQPSTAIASTVMTIATQSIAHKLLQLTANMNAPKETYGLLDMKNEYYWDIMVPMLVSKHYFANTRVREGSVFIEPRLEKKGVNLIASKIPQHIAKSSDDMIKNICKTITNNEKLSLEELLTYVGDVERGIEQDILKGDSTVFAKEKMSELNTYKLKDTPEKTPYFNHMVWESIYAPKYGSPGEPPYTVYKVNLTTGNRTKIKNWIDSIEDLLFKQRVIDFYNKYPKTAINTFYMPILLVNESRGLPLEIFNIIDINKIIANMCRSHYMVLESLWYSKKEDVLMKSLGY